MIMIKDRIEESQETWDAIAESFDKTRRRTWPQCIDFIDSLPKNNVVADIGCGNGRHLIPCARHCKKVIGLDVSKKLLDIVKNKSEQEKLNNILLLQCDAVKMPLKDNIIDAALFIASLHNIRDRDNRIKALKELKRILKKDGRALISVWSKYRDEYKKSFFDRITNKGKPAHGDTNIYWRQHGLNVPRYYHIYRKNKFIKELEEANLEIVDFQEVKLHTKKHPDNYFSIVK